MHRTIYITLAVCSTTLWVWAILDYTATITFEPPINTTARVGIFFSEGHTRVTCSGTCANACTATQWAAAATVAVMIAVIAAEVVQTGTLIAVPIGTAAALATIMLEMRMASEECAPRLPDGSMNTSTTAYRGLYALVSALGTLIVMTVCHCIDWLSHQTHNSRTRIELIELQAMLDE